MNDPKGSLWRKWDLHIHTPESLTKPYSAGGDDPWPRFLDDLEALPPEFKVLGINDYIFIDGYRRLCAEKKKGRLPHIDLLLPVIELRLDRFGGTRGHLSKVNYHIIFSDEIDPDIVEQHFINTLGNKYLLEPQYAGLEKTWKALPTRASLEDLGNKIISSVPIEKRDQFRTPLIEGFSNITFKLDGILASLDSHYFRGRYVTALGKTEWADIKWTDHSIADKKNLINSADLVFVAASDPGAWERAQKALEGSAVNSRLLDCSDAHHFSDSSEKDRIGNCFTWVKADTTFEGLQHAIKGYKDRVFVGDLPDKLRRVHMNRTKYVRSVSIHKVPGASLPETWFDCSVDFNHDLVAVIGNKGSGKSALVDILGLLGQSKEYEAFSFLNPQKFCQPRDNKARHFEATLTWESGETVQRHLDLSPGIEDVQRIKYIPQHFLERICNELGTSGQSSFDQELKSVIFSHVELADRLGQDSLDGLIAYRTQQTYASIDLRKNELKDVNERIIDLEGQLQPEHRRSIENLLEVKKAELEALDGTRPVPVIAPEQDASRLRADQQLTDEINSQTAALSALDLEIKQATERQAQLALRAAIADRLLARLENFRRQYQAFTRECAQDLAALDLTVDSAVRLDINPQSIIHKRDEAQQAKTELDRALSQAGSGTLLGRKRTVEAKIRDFKARLDEPAKKYQEYLLANQAWEQTRAQLVGDVRTPGTLAYYEGQLADLTTLPPTLRTARAERMGIMTEVYSEITRLAASYRDLYRPVQEFIEHHPLGAQQLQLRFEVSIVEDGFVDHFLDHINQRIVGSFSGVEEGLHLLQGLIAKRNFDLEGDVVAFVTDVMEHLIRDKRSAAGGEVRIADQLRSGKTLQGLYEWLFSLGYLKPRYLLKMGDKELRELSPGERGTLLLIFYLLVDKDDVPLVIDQPEENLDNQTVYELLVPCIREAKTRRQILIVTHNPNLAVVCDAEQVVCAYHNKPGDQKIWYVAGAIENPVINRRIVDVLEGTRPAFDTRESKYLPES